MMQSEAKEEEKKTSIHKKVLQQSETTFQQIPQSKSIKQILYETSSLVISLSVAKSFFFLDSCLTVAVLHERKYMLAVRPTLLQLCEAFVNKYFK